VVLFGPQGALMVDAQFTQLQQKVLETIRTFTDAPIRIVVNTHLHGDHTGGDAFFAKQGALLFSREELRDELLQPAAGANGAPAPAPDAASLPVVTYPLGAPGSSAVKIYLDGEVVDFISAPASHTGGDTIIRFEHANAVAIGDFYRNYGYPVIDLAHGGSVEGLLSAIDVVEKIAGDDTTVIPGHGTLVKKADLLPYRAMVADVLAKTKQLVAQGKSLNDVLAANLTAPYDASVRGGTPQTKTRFITTVYNEVKGAKQ
jgi:cyclase